MSQPLTELFAARAAAAFLYEQNSRMPTVSRQPFVGTPEAEALYDALAQSKTLEYYEALQAQILTQCQAYAAHWTVPRGEI